ncbi:hypothetical protein, partial [Paenibacillus jilunlii]
GKLTFGASTKAFLPLFPGKLTFGASTTAFLPLFSGPHSSFGRIRQKDSYPLHNLSTAKKHNKSQLFLASIVFQVVRPVINYSGLSGWHCLVNLRFHRRSGALKFIDH